MAGEDLRDQGHNIHWNRQLPTGLGLDEIPVTGGAVPLGRHGACVCRGKMSQRGIDNQRNGNAGSKDQNKVTKVVVVQGITKSNFARNRKKTVNDQEREINLIKKQWRWRNQG
jgi:hypothetical protein